MKRLTKIIITSIVMILCGALTFDIMGKESNLGMALTLMGMLGIFLGPLLDSLLDL